MEHFISTIGKKTFTALCIGLFLALFFLARFAFATEPTPQERAAAELPTVLNEISRTQEYADRNAAAKLRKDAISACISTGNCEGF